MSTDRERWDARHAAAGELRDPDAFVVEVLDELGEGAGRSALDLACGTGRHALELARRGWLTTACDVSGVGLERLRELAAARSLDVETRRVDLTEPGVLEGRFDLVVVVDFLDRDLYAELADRLSDEGNVIVSTFTVDWPEEHPSRRFRLARAELAELLPGTERVRYEERGGRAGIWARRACG